MPTSVTPVTLPFADADARLGGVLSAEFDGAGPAPGGFANVLFFDGDLTLEGDFLPAVAELLGADVEGSLEMVVVTGDLTVNGCIAIYEDRPALYVGGYTRAETLEGGDAEIYIHDGAFTHFVYGWYNHGSLEAGVVDTPCSCTGNPGRVKPLIWTAMPTLVVSTGVGSVTWRRSSISRAGRWSPFLAAISEAVR